MLLKWILTYFLNRHKILSIKKYLENLSKDHESWQVLQAKEAVKLYIYYTTNYNKQKNIPDSYIFLQNWLNIEENIRKIIRLRHLSYQTEKASIGWLKKKFQPYIQADSLIHL